MPDTKMVTKGLKDQVQLVRISEQHNGQRLDNFLIRELKGVPRSRIYRLIRRGEVRVNKKRSKPDLKLFYGDKVRIPPIRTGKSRDITTVSAGLAQLLENSLLLETDLLLVINKPAGLSVHGGTGIRLGLIEALRQIREEWRNLELAHRLDRDTSGCLVIAKNPNILKWIQTEFKERRVEKTYHVLVHGKWPKELEKVDAAIQKNQFSSGERVVQVQEGGKAAETYFKVLQHFSQATLMEAKPTTGRTHQIRVHCQHAGYPIIGDQKYTADFIPEALKSVKKLCLHATKIRFSDPASDRKLEVEANWDKYFQILADKLNNI